MPEGLARNKHPTLFASSDEEKQFYIIGTITSILTGRKNK
jgi:hypothetical protein